MHDPVPFSFSFSLVSFWEGVGEGDERCGRASGWLSVGNALRILRMDETKDRGTEEEGQISQGWFGSVSRLVSRVSEVDYGEVLDTCMKDLVEFRTVLKEDSMRVAESTQDSARSAMQEHGEESSRNVTDGGRVQEGLDTVGKSLEDIGKTVYSSTWNLFGQIRDAVDTDMGGKETGKLADGTEGFSQDEEGGTSRTFDEEFDKRVKAMQRDSGTYCDEPEDEEDFRDWLEAFDLEKKRKEVEEILQTNSFMNELQSRIVPTIVEYDEFWTHYFYKLHKLKEEYERPAAKQTLDGIENTNVEDPLQDVDEVRVGTDTGTT